MTEISKPDKAGVIIFPPLLYFIAILLGILISYFFPVHLIGIWFSFAIGILFIMASLFLVLSARKLMIAKKTTINPRGVSTGIVKEGIFLNTRNPMYLGFTLFFTGTMFISQSWWGLTVLIPLLWVVRFGIIGREESYLARKFGEEYLTYKSQVRRWF